MQINFLNIQICWNIKNIDKDIINNKVIINNNFPRYEDLKRIWDRKNINDNKYKIIISNESKTMLINMYKMININKENINDEVFSKEIDNINAESKNSITYNTEILRTIYNMISQSIPKEVWNTKQLIQMKKYMKILNH